MGIKLKPGHWVAIADEYKMSLLEDIDNEEKGLVGLVADVETRRSFSLIVFSSTGKHLGSDSASLDHLSKIRKPGFARGIELMPVVSVDVLPGFIDTRNGKVTCGLFGSVTTKNQIVTELKNLIKKVQQ